MIGRVKSAAEALLFTPVTSEAKCSRLSFFKSFLLYRLTNFSSLPTFSMDFLSDGDSFHYMDGADTTIRHLVAAGELILNGQPLRIRRPQDAIEAGLFLAGVGVVVTALTIWRVAGLVGGSGTSSGRRATARSAMIRG